MRSGGVSASSIISVVETSSQTGCETEANCSTALRTSSMKPQCQACLKSQSWKIDRNKGKYVMLCMQRYRTNNNIYFSSFCLILVAFMKQLHDTFF